jgi:hypothetical protein
MISTTIYTVILLVIFVLKKVVTHYNQQFRTYP